jgi:enoyl-CoA hydratase/carnithine racemase
VKQEVLAMRTVWCVRVYLAAALGAAGSAAAAENQPYAGQETRAVKALAPETVEGLLAGAGLGYAKAAELNGWPGPLHALELRDELALTEEQVATLEALRADMLARTVPLGQDLLAAERALDDLFAKGDPSPEAVLAATGRIAAIDARLRAAHLVTHLSTAPVLTSHQTMLYGRARGYGDGHADHVGGHGG